MTEETIGALISIPIAFWCIGGVYLYVQYYSDDINIMNKRQFILIVLSSGPFIWAILLLCVILTVFAYLDTPLKVIGKWFNNFYLYLGNRETKRVKCPYCTLEPLQSTIKKYGMCGLCHRHGRGYNNRRIKI